MAAERPSTVASQKQRTLSEDFFKKLESNNLQNRREMVAQGETKASPKEGDGAQRPRGRGSVAANAAMFESAIQANSTLPSAADSLRLRKVNNNTAASDVNSNNGSQRNSVKNLVMQF